MSLSMPTRQQLSHAIDELPIEVLPELASFLDYLRFKVGLSPLTSAEQPATGSVFLHSIVGIGECDDTDLSVRDEEILTTEIDPIRGWGLPREDA